MPDKTLQAAAEELHEVVVALKELIEREYPRRDEVERTFLKKEDSRRKFTLVLIIIMVSTLLSFVGVVGTVSHCFLSRSEHSICAGIPGYENRNMRRDELYLDMEKLENENQELRDRVLELELKKR